MQFSFFCETLFKVLEEDKWYREMVCDKEIRMSRYSNTMPTAMATLMHSVNGFGHRRNSFASRTRFDIFITHKHIHTYMHTHTHTHVCVCLNRNIKLIEIYILIYSDVCITVFVSVLASPFIH